MTWYGFLARLGAILHKIAHPSHKMRWRTNMDEICPGDIVCETCDIVFWCRALELSPKELEKQLKT